MSRTISGQLVPVISLSGLQTSEISANSDVCGRARGLAVCFCFCHFVLFNCIGYKLGQNNTVNKLGRS